MRASMGKKKKMKEIQKKKTPFSRREKSGNRRRNSPYAGLNICVLEAKKKKGGNHVSRVSIIATPRYLNNANARRPFQIQYG